MPPELLDVLDASSTTKAWKIRCLPAEPVLVGLRGRVLLLVGFSPLRRSELSVFTVDQVTDHPYGLVIAAAPVEDESPAAAG